nr:hypothetical protein [Methylogaea oryzae]
MAPFQRRQVVQVAQTGFRRCRHGLQQATQMVGQPGHGVAFEARAVVSQPQLQRLTRHEQQGQRVMGALVGGGAVNARPSSPAMLESTG